MLQASALVQTLPLSAVNVCGRRGSHTQQLNVLGADQQSQSATGGTVSTASECHWTVMGFTASECDSAVYIRLLRLSYWGTDKLAGLIAGCTLFTPF
eukprot:1157741-Pelagomonas_calceolata.AAC.2